MRLTLLDKILKLEPAKRLLGSRYVNPKDDYFCDHFPGNPIVPGVPLVESRLTCFFIVLGIILRVSQYLANRSLWSDECSLALNVLHRSLPGLLAPLDYNQGAPLGFLVASKAFVSYLGQSEYVLRLFPLLCGLSSLLLFWMICRSFVRPRATLLAVALFSFSEPLVYYSSEFKQYSSDVLITLLSLWLGLHLLDGRKLSLRNASLVAIGGASMIWVSHPAVFILAAIGAIWVTRIVIKKQWQILTWTVVIGFSWGLSFLVLYWVSLRNLTNNVTLIGYWESSFAPFPPVTFSRLAWYFESFLGLFRVPGGLRLEGLGALAFVTGCWAVGHEEIWKLSALVIPLLLTLVASALHLYPFGGRLVLFSAPIVILLVGQGVDVLSKVLSGLSSLLGLALLGLMFFPHTIGALSHLRVPIAKEEIRPVLRTMAKDWQSGDNLYVYYGAKIQFTYYRSRCGSFEDGRIVYGIESRENWIQYEDDLRKLEGHNRTWILFSHVYNWRKADEERLFILFLDKLGKRVKTIEAPGSRAYLYDFSSGGLIEAKGS